MLKNILKRTTSLVLAFVMVLGLLPVLTVPAAALDASIQYLSFSEKDSNGTWTASGKTITCEVTDNDESTTKCGETTYNWTSRSTSLTITNTSGSKGTLKLSPEKTDGQGTTDAQTSYTLDVDGSITITVTSKGNGSNKTGDTTIYTFRDITFVPETQTTVYFSPAVNGTYTVDGVDVGTGISGTKTNTEAYTLQVASVSEGYSFLGWYETVNGVESLYSSSDPASYLATEGANVTAKFVPSAPANFDVGNRTFTNFGDALTYQQISGATTIVVLQDCTIPAGNYTIPAGVTLLVPFDGANTLYTNAPGTVEAYGTPTRYRTLTLASGANIVVNGAISVSAKQSSATVGAPTGPYGELHMSTGSTITCNSGAKLYAWGFITGSGTIQMNSGSTVYEDFQIADWRGGNATNNMRIGKWLGGASENEGKGVFPFSQYYVQNVQVPMTLEYGAEEKVYVSISAGGTVTERELSFIGTSALFQSREGGTIKKDYDESTDRLKVDVTGTLDIGSISLGFNIGISVTVDSSDYVLPINGNMTVTAKSGGTINISKDVAFLPGAELIIERGAKSVISAGTKAVVYDADNWGNYCAQAGKSVPAPFAVGRGSTRWNVNTDASICVNGTLDASAGALYTTEGGANIYSTTTQPGTVIMTAGTETTAYQATQSGTDITYSDIPITSAKLKNSNTTTENGEYTITADATSATTYYYSYDGYWSDTFEVTFKPNLPESGTYTVDGTEQQTEADIVKSVTNPLGTVVTPPVLTMNGYTFDGWYTQADGSGTKVDFSQSIARRSPTVYAKWKGDAGVGYKVEHYWQNADGTTYTMESEALSGTAGTTATAVQQSRTGFAVNTSKSTLSGMVKADGSLVLAVYYDRETYTITFDTDGGSAVGAIAKIHGAEVGTVAAPTREGYTFAGWDTTIPATMPMENMTIKAQWTINQYTITFDTDGGSAVAAIKQDYGTAVTAPADPTKTGYKFTGWNVEVPATMPARDMTITAQWTINQYTITFDTDGGSAVAPITQDYNTAVTAPSNPTKEGYTFADWDVEVPSTMPAGDMTITAQWTIESYTINFDAAGGSKVGSITAEYGAPITMPDDPTKTGYSFAGWSESYTTMPDCGDNGTTKTITAQWTANTYTVQFNANGGTGAMDAQSGFVYDEAQNLTANNGAITKEGYSFTGWNTEADGSGTAYADGASVKNLSSDVDGSVTLFAQWSINGYTLTLKANGGKFSNDSDTYTTTLHYGVTIENLPEPTRTGYTFSGWSPKIPETMPAEDMVITAMWEILQYTITFVNEGETVGTITQNYGTTISESNVPVVSKPGYRFVGWDKEIPTTMPAESMTITAQWEAESYTVTLNPGELGSFVGSEAGTPTVVQVTYGKNYASEEAPLPTPTRVGYNFIAWQDESGNTITYSSEVAIPKNHELTAVWDPMKFQVTFNAGEGSFEDDVETQWTVTYDSTYGAMEGSDTLKELPTPKREGHTFLGWFTSTAEDTPAAPPLMLEEETTQSDAKVTSDAKVQIVENTTLYARWEINYYTITLDRDDGTEPEKIVQLFNTPLSIADPVREGHTFRGWDVDIPNTMPADNLTIKATWDINQYTITFVNGNETVKTITQDYDATIARSDVPAVSRNGYTFSGWDKDIPDKMPAYDMIITAQWDANEYQIVFDSDGGTPVDTITADCDTVIIAPAAPTKTGFTFIGWDPALPNAMPAGGLSVKAIWKVNQYSIIFDTDGGSAVAPITADYSEPITAPAAPTREGYTFLYWQNTAGEEYTIPAKMPAENVEVKAVWSINCYTITFNPNGENVENSESSREVTYGEAYGILPEPTRDGYGFNGWFTESNGGTQVTAETVMGAADVTVYAHWNKSEYGITYVLNGGSVNGTNPTTYSVTTPNFALIDPVKTGYSFTGWNLCVDGEEQGNVGKAYVVMTGTTGELSFTATWTANTYTVQFNANGGEGTMAEQGGFVYDETKNLKANAGSITKEGYSFAGWNTEADGSGTACADGAAVKNLSSTVNGRVTLYAQWTANTYTVQFDANGGTGSMAEQIGFVYDEAKNLTANEGIITKEGYTFAGWNAERDGSGTAYADGALVKNLSSAVNGCVILYAQWTINNYELKLHANGGMFSSGGDTYTTTVEYNAAPETLPEPTREGYTFTGWGAEIPSTMPAENLEFTAQWSINSYTMTWIVDGVETEKTYEYGAAIEKIADPAKTGYTFTGWGAEIPDTMPAEDLEFTAQWRINSYTVTWIVDGEKTEKTYKYGETVEKIADPSKPGYTFTGWDTEIPNTMPAEDLEFTAQWRINSYTVTWIVDGEKTEKTYEYGAAVEKIADPAKTGYTFTGWGAEVPDTMPAENLEFTAQWRINSYTVTWIVDGVETEKTYEYGAAIEKLADPAKTGYTFTGWGAEIPDTMPAENLEFTAQWSINSYTVTWIVNDVKTEKTYEYGVAVEKPSDPSKPGYTFTGWGAEVPDTMPAENLEFTAQWSINSYTVSWIVDGEKTEKTYEYGATIEKFADPAKTGYTFTGWGAEIPSTMPAENLEFTAQWNINSYTVTWIVDGEKTEKTYEYGAAIEQIADPAKIGYTFTGWGAEIPSTMPAENLEFTAQWRINSYTVTWIVDGEKTEKTYEYGAAIEQIADPAKTGYTFTGWGAEIPSTMPAEDLEFTAQWRINSYTVTWIVDGEKTEKTYEYGATIEKIADPAKTGYTFTGWGAEVPETMPAENLEFTAQWRINSYTVTWIVDSEKTEKTYEYGATIEKIADPSKPGYIFTGWDVEIPETMPAENVTITATWESYLDKLVDIPAVDIQKGVVVQNPDTTALDLARGYYALLNSQQKAAYATEEIYASHYAVFREVVVKYAETQLIKGVKAAEDSTNEVLSDVTYSPSESETITVDVARITVDSTTAEGMLIFDQFPALLMLDIPFLMELFAYEEIKQVYVPCLETSFDKEGNRTWQLGSNPYTLNRKDRNEAGGMTKTDQFNIMFLVAWAALAPETSHEEFLNGLYAQMSTLTIGLLDGKTVEVELIAQTAEGFEYKVLFTIHFHNQNHYAIWHWGEITRGVIAENLELVLPAFAAGEKVENTAYEAYPEGSMVTLPDDPAKEGEIFQPTKEGYTFEGWVDAQGKLISPDTEGGITAMERDHLIYTGKWRINQYTITFDTDGGTEIAPITADYGAAITTPAVEPTKIGHTFTGWDTELPPTMPAVNMTIKALWSVNKYTYTFDTNGGSEMADLTRDYGSEIGAVGEPVREGYTFVGWVDKNGDAYTFPATMPAESIALTAVWSVNSYTITFDTDGGTPITPITQEYGTAVNAPSDPSKSGYTFAGWDVEIPATMPARDINIKAIWTVNQYTIVFDSDGGSAVDPITADYGEAITEPETIPTKTGYTFKEWSPAVPKTMPVNGLTVTALWTPNTYQVILNPNGGVLNSSDEVTVTYGETYSALYELPVPSKEGYTFDCWMMGDQRITANTRVEITDNITLTAAWLVGDNYYSIDFDLNEGGWESGVEVPKQFNVESEDIVLPAPVKIGYTFLGWTGSNGNEPELTVIIETGSTGNKAYVANWQVNQYTITFVDTGDVVYEPITKDYGAVIGAVADPVKTGYTFQGWSMAIPNTMPAENLTITAAWEINRYTITFDTDGGTTISPITRNYGETVGTVADPTKEGYTFVGWNPALPDTMPSENLTVTAQWAVNQYTITFDTGGGTPVDSITADYGATIVAPVAPEKEGHTFAGWSVKIPTTMPAKNMTITAYWTVNSYTITFLDTGDEEYAPITRDYGADVGDVADPVKTGYTFIGWDTEIPVTMPAGNLVITAMWKINQYTITFDTDGGTEIAPITADFGTPITAPADPVKEGYTFAGWSPALPATMPGENLTVKAQWRTNQYTITFDTDGGTEVAPITADYGANVTAPMAPTKEGHTFIGWLPSLPSTMPAGDLTVKAQWAVNQYTITFKSNGGSYVDSITGDYGAAIAAPAAPERKGYTFAGWVPTLPDTMPAQNMAVTAQWTANTYVVTLDADGGSVENDRITVTYDAAYTLPEPTRQGYTFVGWFNRDDGSQQIALTGVVNFAQDLVLKARWNAKGDTPYKVEHYQQNLTDDKYTLVKTDEGTGASGSVVEVSQLNDAGFRVNEGRSVLKGTIAGDGTLVLRVYYDRKVYTVSWNVAGTITNQDYRYGAIPDDSAINTERASDSSASYIFNGWDKELVPVSGDVTYTAQFTKRYEAALINADGTVRATYSELAYALKNVPPGSVLRLEADATLTENLWIPAGVTLVLPCMDDDPGYVMRNSGKLAFNPDGTDTSGAVGQGPNAKLYRALNIPSNIQVVVQGAILVNAVTGRPSAGNYDMDVTGGYSQIQLDGTIVVADGGKLDCFGYVKGEGTLIATSGGTVGDLYIVRHWRGGTHGLAMFEEDVYPMNEADCRNIEANLKIEYGAKLDGLVKMYAGGTYNYTRFPQVDSSNGLIRLAGRSSFVVRSYDAVNEREVYEISGGANFAASTLTIVGVPLTSSDFLYPIDGDMDFILKKGDYSFVNDYKVMPGATMTVAGNATLTIAEQAAIETPGTDKGDDGKVTVVFYDEYNDLYTGPTQYPTGMAAAKVILEDGATFTNKGVFAGTIYTNSDNVLVSNQVTPVWNAVSRETEAASVVSGGKLGKRHVDLLFDLAIYREGYTWRFGETDRGEVEGSIIWYKDDVVSVNAQIAQTSDTSITVRTEVYNTTDVAVECNLYIAVYDSQNRLIAVKICDGYVLGTNQFNELRDFTIAIDKVAATVKLFLVDADFVPMTDMVPLNVK